MMASRHSHLQRTLRRLSLMTCRDLLCRYAGGLPSEGPLDTPGSLNKTGIQGQKCVWHGEVNSHGKVAKADMIRAEEVQLLKLTGRKSGTSGPILTNARRCSAGLKVNSCFLG